MFQRFPRRITRQVSLVSHHFYWLNLKCLLLKLSETPVFAICFHIFPIFSLYFSIFFPICCLYFSHICPYVPHISKYVPCIFPYFPIFSTYFLHISQGFSIVFPIFLPMFPGRPVPFAAVHGRQQRCHRPLGLARRRARGATQSARHGGGDAAAAAEGKEART